MIGIVDIDRLMRLRATRGMPIHSIIEMKLVGRADWVEYCGATYRDPRGKWVKGRDGSMRYVGEAPKHGG